VKWDRPLWRELTIPAKVDAGIIGIVGHFGQGKGMLMSQMIGEDVEKGRRVVTNFPWWHPALSRVKGEVISVSELRGWDCKNEQAMAQENWEPCDCGYCLASLRNAVLYIDEISAELPARFWGQVPRGLLRRVVQVRHGGLRLVWAAQREKQVDVYVRSLTAHIWHCRAWLRGLWVTAKALDPEEFVQAGEEPKVYGRRFVVARKSLFKSYDSYGYVEEGLVKGGG